MVPAILPCKSVASTDRLGDLAEPATLLGLLQRGRGAGYLAALTHPEQGAAIIVHCISHDPRWDRQVEERAWFYASLVAELHIELAQLRAAFDPPPSQSGDAAGWLATDVFSLSARRGLPGGVSELRRYLLSGRDPQLALSYLVPLAGHPEAVGLLDDVLDLTRAGSSPGIHHGYRSSKISQPSRGHSGVEPATRSTAW